MIGRIAAAAVVGWLAFCVAIPASRADPDPPFPRGSRVDGDRHVSALGFRATADWYQRLWRRRGLVVRTLGPYRVAGVDVIRYLRDDAGPWRAVHVYRVGGTTWIAVVASPAAAAPPPLDGAGATE